MEIKQLEYFIAAADFGSLNRAAEQLYTTQPNVSKVISGLEKELNTSLFDRNNRGIRMTPQGEQLYTHAVSILKHSSIIRSMSGKQCTPKFSISGYPSNLLTRLLTELYNERAAKSQLKYEYREGTVETITDDVSGHVSEIGIVYLAKTQLNCFNHIIGHKNLEFIPMGDRGICLYIGENHPLYQQESVDFSQLEQLKFVEEIDDFFSMEHHIERISVGALQLEQMNHVFYTNSDYMLNNLLLNTDVCCLGFDLVSSSYSKYAIKALKVKGCEPFMTIGYVKLNNTKLSTEARHFIEKLHNEIENY